METLSRGRDARGCANSCIRIRLKFIAHTRSPANRKGIRSRSTEEPYELVEKILVVSLRDHFDKPQAIGGTSIIILHSHGSRYQPLRQSIYRFVLYRGTRRAIKWIFSRHTYARGFAHGYQTLTDDTAVMYSVSAAYSPGHQRGARWDDPAFGIDWPLGPPAVIHERDASYPDIRVQA